MTEHMRACFFRAFLVLLLLWAPLVPVSETSSIRGKNVLSFWDGNGIRVVFNDAELYFNASNGGEITEYYDLSIDPQRQRNLVDLSVVQYKNLLPLFASIFYYLPLDLPFSTGGDSNAIMEQVAMTSQYIIIQTSSRLMTTDGLIAVDAYGNTIYMNTTWVIRNDGIIFVERTLYLRNYASIPLLWEWYPFYFTRVQGFDYNATFYMFNTTYTKTFTVNKDNYPGFWGLPKLFNDTKHVSGVAIPFSNITIEGDGTHNFIIVYRYDEFIDVNEWRSDNYNNYNVTETGAKHRFFKSFNVTTHTYHTMVRFTHQPINEENVQDLAKYFAVNSEQAHLMKIQLITDKNTYNYGDPYVVSISGLSNYDVNRITGRLTIKDRNGQTILANHYGPSSLTRGQTFNTILLTGTVSPKIPKGNYTLTFQIFSSPGILIASDSKMVELI